jgi:DNA topoisomerase-1
LRLIHVSPDSPGYARRKRGKGFAYFDTAGKLIKDKPVIDRIAGLRIPPAWRDVWICPNPEGHLQATGKDARDRKQYLYHEEWTRRSNLRNFDRMAGFAKILPSLRKKINGALRKEGWPREKVIALIITILDQSGVRIGNKVYETQNGSYGLTTLRRKHLKVEKGQIVFEFKAKSGVYRRLPIKSKRLARLIKECSELPGQEVFRFEDDAGETHPVMSQDVNAYLHEITESDYTAKDFRTWNGTVGAIELFRDVLDEKGNPGTKSFTTALVRRVAEKLGNTMAVCRAHYIHPCMLKLAEAKEVSLDDLFKKAEKEYPDLKDDLDPNELAALYLIEKG